MATLTVRKLADSTYENLGRRAKANNRSLEAEVRDILDREAKAFDIKAWVADLRELKRQNPITLPPGEDAVSLVRKERDSW
jgi:plasmid stability protein